MKKLKVALVVGHRENKQGAVGAAGMSEWKFYDALAKDIKLRFSFADDVSIKIFYRKVRGSGYNERMTELHKRIDEWGANISISLHFNSTNRHTVTGHEVLYCSSSKTSARLAESLNNSFSAFLPNRDRGSKARKKGDRGGGFLCKGKSYCVLAEPFFGIEQNNYMPTYRYRELLIDAFYEFIRGASAK